jgi:hypothetical protein
MSSIYNLLDFSLDDDADKQSALPSDSKESASSFDCSATGSMERRKKFDFLDLSLESERVQKTRETDLELNKLLLAAEELHSKARHTHLSWVAPQLASCNSWHDSF